jgi:hypothetical protein
MAFYPFGMLHPASMVLDQNYVYETAINFLPSPLTQGNVNYIYEKMKIELSFL